MVLRYHPEALCKEKGVVANHIPTASASFKFWGAGDQDQDTASKNLTLLVQNETTEIRHNSNGSFQLAEKTSAAIAPSLYIGPVMKRLDYATCTQVETPQLWAVTNLKQTAGESSRRFVIASRIQTGNQCEDNTQDGIETSFDAYFPMQFDEPSTKVFAFEPSTKEQLTVFEEDPLVPYHYIAIACCSLNPDAPNNCFLDGLGTANNKDFPKGLATEYFSKIKNAAIGECANGATANYEECKTKCNSETECIQGCEDAWTSDNGQGYGCMMNAEYLAEKVYNDQTKTMDLLETPIGQMIDDTRALAEEKAFWRGKSTTLWCDSNAPSKCFQNGKFDPQHAYDQDCCRATVDEWRNMTPKNVSQQEPCTFCNQTDKYPDCSGGECSETAPDVYQCDSRCQQISPTEGSITIGYRETWNYSTCAIPVVFTPNSAYMQPLQSILKTAAQECQASGICNLLFANGKPECVVDANGNILADANENLSESAENGNYYACPAGKIIAVRLLESQNKVFKSSVDFCFTGYCALVPDETFDKPLCDNDVPAVADGDFYRCASGNIQTTDCTVPCANWCGEPNCGSSCPASGLYWNETYGPLEQNGWLTQHGDQPVQTIFSATIDDSQTETFQNYRPYSYFPEDYRYTPGTREEFIQYGPSYRHSILVNTLDLTGFDFYEGFGLSDANAWRAVGVSGCQHESGDYWNNQGLYDLRFGNELIASSTMMADLWQGNLSVVSLKMSDQLGATRCDKGNQAQNPITAQELCAPVYADKSVLPTGFGNCVNSMWSVYGSETADKACGDVLKWFLYDNNGDAIPITKQTSCHGSAPGSRSVSGGQHLVHYWTPGDTFGGVLGGLACAGGIVATVFTSGAAWPAIVILCSGGMGIVAISITGSPGNSAHTGFLYDNGVFEVTSTGNHNTDLNHACNAYGKCEKGCGGSS